MKNRIYIRATWIMLALVVALVVAAPVHAQEFVGLLNQARAARGLRPVAYDGNAAAVAYQNNLAQLARGLGHHVLGGYGQVAAVGMSGPYAALQAWSGSPGHAAIIFSPDLISIGFSQVGGCCTASTQQGFAAVPIYGAVYRPAQTWAYPARRGGRRR